MSAFHMPLSPDAEELLESIVAEMQVLFDVPRPEAIARVNEMWHGRDFSVLDESLCHEDEYYWTLVIYFDGRVLDWRPGVDRSSWSVKPAPALDSGHWPSIDG
jgi:hypothetical protein